MKKIYLILVLASLGNPIYADSLTDGMSDAGDAVYGYIPYVQTFGFVLACIIGIIGAFIIYHAIVNNEQNVRKRIITWGGSCMTMLCMTLAMPQFFGYEEGLGNGMLADGNAGSGSFGRFVGGDDYGRLIVEIPDLSDPRWSPDPIYDRRILPFRPRFKQ